MIASAGIDPDKGGAVALLHGDEARVWDTPLLTRASGKTDIDPWVVSTIAKELKERGASVAIEMAGPLPAKFKGALANYWRGRCFAMWEQALACHQVPFTIVHAATWKKAMGCQGDHDACRRRAHQLMPAAAGVHVTLKKHHGRAAALLLARYESSRNNAGGIR